MKFIAYSQQNELNSIIKHVFLVFFAWLKCVHICTKKC